MSSRVHILLSRGEHELGYFFLHRAKEKGGKQQLAAVHVFLVRDMMTPTTTDTEVEAMRGNSLRVKPTGDVDCNGGFGVWASFHAEDVGPSQHGGGVQCRLVNHGHSLRNEAKTYLCWSRPRGYATTNVQAEETVFTMRGVKDTGTDAIRERIGAAGYHENRNRNGGGRGGGGDRGVTVAASLAAEAAMVWSCSGSGECRELSWDDKVNFVRYGYLVLRGTVRPDVTDAALRAINRGLSSPIEYFRPINENMTGKLEKRADQEAVNRLLVNRHVMTALEGLMKDVAIASDMRDRPLSLVGHQVALRYPANDATIANPPDLFDTYRRQWHVDGIREGRLTPFSLLVGVALSDQLVPSAGNLWTIPGSHVPNAQAIASVYDAMQREGIDFTMRLWEDRKPNFESITPQPVLLAKGDVVIVHSKTAHSIGLNLSSNIRYQVYFRVSHRAMEHTAHLESINDTYFGFNDDIKLIAYSM